MRKFRAFRDTGAPLDLTESLGLLRRSSAADPRNKGYALYGLAAADGKITVDYSCHVTEVYTQTAISTIVASQNFDILAHCNYPPILPRLPTRVPDWSDNYSWLPLAKKGISTNTSKAKEKVCCVSGDPVPDFEFNIKKSELILTGILVEPIVFLPSDSRDSRENLEKHLAGRMGDFPS